MRTVILRNGMDYRAPTAEGQDQLHQALGYLVNWGRTTHTLKHLTYVDLSVHSNGNLVAAYWRDAEDAGKPGRPGFLIHAVLEPNGSYSFNS